MGTDLPFLPFATEEEYKQFADCALRNDFPMENADAAAIAWCKLVDGVKIFPKLPVHIRIHKESFERNQRVKACVERAKSGQEKLDELNNALKPAVAANSTPAAICEALPDIQQDALHNLPYVTTGGTAVGTLPLESTEKKRKRGDRGKDKSQRTRRCGRCIKFDGEYANKCSGKGHGGSTNCQYFEPDGNVK
jgi:hypothetical protein